MGLDERRKIKELQEVTLPARSVEIQEICGKPIAYDVDWDSMADDPVALNFLDNLSCHRLNMALRMICRDDLGKQSVRDSLKSVKLKNIKDKATKQINFQGGILEMRCAYAMGVDGAFSDGEIREILEKGL